MGYEELIGDLQREAERKKESVLTAAREEARQIVADAMQQSDRLEREFQDSLARDLERERERLLNRARREARTLLTRTRSDLLEQVFRRLEERLAAVASEKRYPSVVERLLNETLPEWPKGEVIVRTDPRTRAILKPLLGDRTVRFEPIAGAAPGEDPFGGFELSDRAGAVTILNTFRSRLQKARPELLIEVNRSLFENPPGG